MDNSKFCVTYQCTETNRGIIYNGSDEKLAKRLWAILSVASPHSDIAIHQISEITPIYRLNICMPLDRLIASIPQFRWDKLMDIEKQYLQKHLVHELSVVPSTSSPSTGGVEQSSGTASARE